MAQASDVPRWLIGSRIRRSRRRRLPTAQVVEVLPTAVKDVRRDIQPITGGLDFSNYYTPLSTKVQPDLSYVDAKKQGAVLGWGQFLTVALNFLIIAGVLFLAIKGINKLKKEAPPATPEPTPEVALLTEIRDLLKRG